MRNRSSFGRHFILLTFVFVLFSGIFGLGTVWLRQQIAVMGSESQKMERRLQEVERQESKTTVEIALAVSPFHLEQQNVRFALGLRQPQERQVVRVDSQTQQRFAQFRNEQFVSLSNGVSYGYRAESNQ